MDMQKKLNQFLRSQNSNAGRESPYIRRLSAKSGLSVHMLQSVAYGRRSLSKDAEKRLSSALWQCGWFR
jgi:hypothetical protein